MKAQSKTKSIIFNIIRLVVMVTFLLQMTGVAKADVTETYGDNVEPVVISQLVLGNLCLGSPVSKPIYMAIRRTGGGQVFQNGSTVTFSVSGNNDARLTTSFKDGKNTITLPANWTGIGNQTISDMVSVVASFTSSEIKALSQTVTVTASGMGTDNKPMTRSTTIQISATVYRCDVTPPTLTLPQNMTVEASGAAGAVVTFTATATDTDPASPVVTCAPASGSTFPFGTTTVNCSAQDTVGNKANGSFTVTVQDTTPPVISGTPSDQSVEATSGAGATATYTAPTALDAVDGARTVTCDTASGSTFPLGANTVTCSASDTRNNAASVHFTVTVVDTTAPALSLKDVTAEATGANGATVNYTASAQDLVDGAVDVTCAPASGTVFALGTTAITCSAQDAHTNTAHGTFNITVQDTTAPVITVPADITAEAAGPQGVEVSYDNQVSAIDVVDGAIVPSCLPASGSTFALDAKTEVTCSATDASQNTASQSFLVTVVDKTAPVLSLPDHLAAVEASGPSGAAVSFDPAPAALDTVDGNVVVSCDHASGATYPLGETTVTCSAVDKHGNEAEGSFTVSVVDTTPPELTLPGLTTQEAEGPAGAKVSFTATALDRVDGTVTVSCTPDSGATFALDDTTVTCSATDAHDNTATGQFIVRVVDTTPPTLQLSADQKIEATGPGGAVGSFAPTATDLVDGNVEVTCAPASGATFPLGITTVKCSAADQHGNLQTGSFTIEVVDTTAPALALPSDMTVEGNTKGGATVSFSATASDLVDVTDPVTCTPASGATFPLGTTPVTCTTEDAHGNKATGSFKVTVQDTIAPALSLPGNMVEEATGPKGAVISFAATASDIVDENVTVTCTPASGATFALGATKVDCSATDASNNTASGSFTVTVQDTTAPALTLPANMSVEGNTKGGAKVSFSPTALDIVDGDVAVACAPASDTVFQLGPTTVNCSAKDAHANEAKGSFTITVKDTTAPAITCPANIVGTVGQTVNLGSPTVADIVDAAPVVANDAPASFGPSTTLVKWTATDHSNNQATCTQSVTLLYKFDGFYQPVDNMNITNTVKNGSTVPLKWNVMDASGSKVTTVSVVAVGWPKMVPASCSSFNPTEDAVETLATGSTSLRYDLTGMQFIYNWQTPKAPGTCWRLDVKFTDGTTKSANFKLK